MLSEMGEKLEDCKESEGDLCLVGWKSAKIIYVLNISPERCSELVVNCLWKKWVKSQET